MKQAKILLFSLIVFAMLSVVGCTNTSTSDKNLSESSEPTTSATEKVLVSVDYVTDELLTKYASFDEFVEFEEKGYQKIIFTTNITVKDFRFIEVCHKEEDTNNVFFENDALYSLDELLPEKPFVVTWMEWGVFVKRKIPTHYK